MTELEVYEIIFNKLGCKRLRKLPLPIRIIKNIGKFLLMILLILGGAFSMKSRTKYNDMQHNMVLRGYSDISTMFNDKYIQYFNNNAKLLITVSIENGVIISINSWEYSPEMDRPILLPNKKLFDKHYDNLFRELKIDQLV